MGAGMPPCAWMQWHTCIVCSGPSAGLSDPSLRSAPSMMLTAANPESPSHTSATRDSALKKPNPRTKANAMSRRMRSRD